jgi:phosphoglycerol transferase MdoB-like AlkP superfamily enzyme
VGAVIGTSGVCAIVLGIFWGESVVSVALAYAIFSVVVSYPSIRIAVSLIDLAYWDVAKGLLPILICALGMASAIFIFKIVLPESWKNWQLLIAQIFFGAALYVSIIHLFRLQSYIEARKLLQEEFKKKIR